MTFKDHTPDEMMNQNISEHLRKTYCFFSKHQIVVSPLCSTFNADFEVRIAEPSAKDIVTVLMRFVLEPLESNHHIV